jgi:hypothetical protein
MLRRPDLPDRHKRFRRRRKAGVACTTVEYDGPVLDLLIRLHWLLEGEAADRDAVGSAITRMIADAARR